MIKAEALRRVKEKILRRGFDSITLGDVRKAIAILKRKNATPEKQVYIN